MIFWPLRIENRARLTHCWPKTTAIFGKHLYVDHVDEIFIRIRIFAHMGHFPQDGENEQNMSEFFCF